MEIGASGAWRAARSRRNCASLQAKGSGAAMIEAVAGGASAWRAQGSAFSGSSSPPGPRISYF